MNAERTFHWIRQVAEVTLEAFDRPEEGGPNGEKEPIEVWLRAVARAALQTLDGLGRSGPEMKPDRIQFWLELITQFVVAVFAGVEEETG